MINIKRVIKNSDVSECLDTLVELHSKHYYTPGCILNRKLIRDKYTEYIDNIIESVLDYNNQSTVRMFLDNRNGIYNTEINGTTLREWVKTATSKQVSSLNIDYPHDMHSNQVLLELLYELTYYSLDKTS